MRSETSASRITSLTFYTLTYDLELPCSMPLPPVSECSRGPYLCLFQPPPAIEVAEL
jgi:hypothetical protein